MVCKCRLAAVEHPAPPAAWSRASNAMPLCQRMLGLQWQATGGPLLLDIMHLQLSARLLVCSSEMLVSRVLMNIWCKRTRPGIICLGVISIILNRLKHMQWTQLTRMDLMHRWSLSAHMPGTSAYRACPTWTTQVSLQPGGSSIRR